MEPRLAFHEMVTAPHLHFAGDKPVGKAAFDIVFDAFEPLSLRVIQQVIEVNRAVVSRETVAVCLRAHQLIRWLAEDAADGIPQRVFKPAKCLNDSLFRVQELKRVSVERASRGFGGSHAPTASTPPERSIVRLDAEDTFIPLPVRIRLDDFLRPGITADGRLVDLEDNLLNLGNLDVVRIVVLHECAPDETSCSIARGTALRATLCHSARETCPSRYQRGDMIPVCRWRLPVLHLQR